MTDLPSIAPMLAARPDNNFRYYMLMAATVIGLLVFLLANPATVDGALNPVFSEGGFVEGLSPMGYGFCIVLIIAMGGLRFAWEKGFALIVVFLAMTLRELDFHTRFTVMSLEKLKFYTSAEVPLGQKAAGLFVLLLLVWAALHLLRRHAGTFIAGLRRFDPVSLATILAIASIVVSKAVDGLNNRFADWGYHMGGESAHVLEKIEETTELGISLFAMIAILAYFGSARDGADTRR